MKSDRLSGIFWIFVALYVMCRAYKMELGTLGRPGSGFFPFVCAAVILLMAVILLIQSLVPGMGLPFKVSQLWKGVSWQRPAVIALIMLGYILILEWAGFVLTSFVLIFLLLKAVEKQSWKMSFAVSFLAIAVSHGIFNILLQLALPRGFLGF